MLHESKTFMHGGFRKESAKKGGRFFALLFRLTSSPYGRSCWPVFCKMFFTAHRTRIFQTVAAALCFAAASDGRASEKVDFNRQIRPLLSDRCYVCHGPDEKARKGKLRLDTEAGATKSQGGGLHVIKPGSPEQSEALRRMEAADPDERMPPPESNLSLSKSEIELIRRWIGQGAEFQTHWSFTPLEKIHPPLESGRDWVRNEIDHFVHARLEREGLAPNPEARRERLLRRVTFDLTGLPPTIPEMDAFLADTTPGAYERVVDRLLGSPSYGERMALEWLDVARYADTYGYQSDRFNHLWPWRDWVVRAFNDNLSYDRFIEWQLAGDLLPNATREQRLATAFNRNHRQTNEGGSINEEWRVEYNADRVKTMGLAFLGLTLECCRCHDHKYDPILQKDYYSFFAFFNSTDESGLYSHFTDAIPNPTLLLYPDDETERRHLKLRREIASFTRQLAEASGKETDEFKKWLGSTSKVGKEISGLVGSFSFDSIVSNKVANAATAKAPGALKENPELIEGKFGKALKFSGENSVDIAGIGDFDRTDSFSLGLWVKIPERRDRVIVLHHSRAGSDAGSRGYELQLENGKASFGLIHFWPGNALKVATRKELPLNKWLHLGITYDGSSRASGLRFFVDGAPAETEIVRDTLFKTIGYAKEEMKVPLQLAARFRGRGFKDGQIDELRIFDRQLSAMEMETAWSRAPLEDAIARLKTSPSFTDRSKLREFHQLRYDEGRIKRAGELQRLRDEENKLITAVPEIMAMGDLPEPRPTFVLNRGAYDSPGEPVTPSAPASLLEFSNDLPRNRLGLAKWLTDPRHPLTARVAVNRYWQLFFGTGICETADDLGSQGKLPSHQELLDWLSGWFIENQWDTKALHKKIVMSAVYSQSSAASVAKIGRDPENRLMARGPSHRLTAEAIRNNALNAGGILREVVGGPSDQSHDQIGHTGAAKKNALGRAFRRSLYLYIKRTAPSPYLVTFDGTGREDCIARRQRTNTPLQALILLNDELFTEASRKLALRMRLEGGESTEERIQFAFRLLTGRRAEKVELDILAGMLAEQRELFVKDPKAAAAYASAGKSKSASANADTIELAALAVVANAIMNFDEAIMKR